MVLVPPDCAPVYEIGINLFASFIPMTISAGWRLFVSALGFPRLSSGKDGRAVWASVASSAFDAARVVTVVLVSAALFYVAVKAAYRFACWITRTGNMLLAYSSN